MALAQIAEIRREKLVHGAARLRQSSPCVSCGRNISGSQFEIAIRGLGLMAGIEICLPGPRAGHHCGAGGHQGNVWHGFILLPEGAHANVISFTPPLTITRGQLTDAVKSTSGKSYAVSSCMKRPPSPRPSPPGEGEPKLPRVASLGNPVANRSMGISADGAKVWKKRVNLPASNVHLSWGAHARSARRCWAPDLCARLGKPIGPG